MISRTKARRVLETLKGTKEYSALDSRLAKIDAALTLHKVLRGEAITKPVLLENLRGLQDHYTDFPPALSACITGKLIESELTSLSTVLEKPELMEGKIGLVLHGIQIWSIESGGIADEPDLLDTNKPSLKPVLEVIKVQMIEEAKGKSLESSADDWLGSFGDTVTDTGAGAQPSASATESAASLGMADSWSWSWH